MRAYSCSTFKTSSSFRKIQHNIQMEANKFVNRFFQQALLIAMRAKAFRSVFAIGHRPHAVALHTFRAQLRHVSSAR